ncbi:hypothetical protein B0F90DRAFT_1757912, partial [Multifurca ochricompacta]
MSSLFDPSSISEGNTLLPISIIFSILLFYTARYINSPYRKLPPGPRGYPIIGNILDIQSKPWFRFTEWRKQYGRSSSLVLQLGLSDQIDQRSV